jgi:Domain of unknown function (DUF222)
MLKTTESDAGRRERFRDFDARHTLTAVDQAKTAARRAEVDKLALAAHWADLHGDVDRASSPALPGSEQLVRIGGDGTAEVAEFASAELGAVLEISTHSATALIADALDLRHRLPRLWRRVLDHQVAPWMAREVAAQSRRLSKDAATTVDARVTPWADRLTWSRLRAVVEAAIIAADPEAADEAARQAADDQGVWLGQSSADGIKEIHIRTEAPNAIWFDASIDRIADTLGALGDDSCKDVRRAKAVGVIAHPQQALDLLGDARENRPAARPKAVLHVHIARETVGGDVDNRVARIEDLGPATVQQVKDWLSRTDVVVKPVLDPAGVAPVDAYEIPDRHREAVHLMTPADAFPYASSVSRGIDVDHTDPYAEISVGGPPGQTAIGNLAKLTRRHHRIKTHGKWQVRQPFPGLLVWRSPHGRTFLVDHTGTRQLTSTA